MMQLLLKQSVEMRSCEQAHKWDLLGTIRSELSGNRRRQLGSKRMNRPNWLISVYLRRMAMNAYRSLRKIFWKFRGLLEGLLFEGLYSTLLFNASIRRFYSDAPFGGLLLERLIQKPSIRRPSNLQEKPTQNVEGPFTVNGTLLLLIVRPLHSLHLWHKGLIPKMLRYRLLSCFRRCTMWFTS